MNLLIIGSNGMLGSICKKYFDANYNVFTLDDYFTLENQSEYLSKFNNFDVDIVINCAGKIKQKTSDLRDLIFVNAILPYLLSKNISKDTYLIQPSTDCVFSGNTEEVHYDSLHPKDAVDEYGISKIFGENALTDVSNALVLRGSIIGLAPSGNYGLLDWFLSHKDNENVDGFTNHFWNGVTTLQWCKNLEYLIKNHTYKNTNFLQFGTKETFSKYEVLKKINHTFNRKIHINPREHDSNLNRCLLSSFPTEIPSLDIQLEELYNFYTKK